MTGANRHLSGSSASIRGLAPHGKRHRGRNCAVVPAVEVARWRPAIRPRSWGSCPRAVASQPLRANPGLATTRRRLCDFLS